MEKWYLSFDCATKTFAYILVKINFKYLFIDTNKIRLILKQLELNLKQNGYSSEVEAIINKINNNTKNAITMIAYGCVDLIPNIANKDISTVDRIKLAASYVKKEIYPLITNICSDQLHILIEFQMSYNTQSKAIATALITLFSDYDVHLVSPTLKNKIYFTKELQYCYFMEKYKNSYVANKNHALYNLLEFEKMYEQPINLSNKLKGHVADAFMQVLGYIMIKQPHLDLIL